MDICGEKGLKETGGEGKLLVVELAGELSSEAERLRLKAIVWGWVKRALAEWSKIMYPKWLYRNFEGELLSNTLEVGSCGKQTCQGMEERVAILMGGKETCGVAAGVFNAPRELDATCRKVVACAETRTRANPGYHITPNTQVRPLKPEFVLFEKENPVQPESLLFQAVCKQDAHKLSRRRRRSSGDLRPEHPPAGPDEIVPVPSLKQPDDEQNRNIELRIANMVPRASIPRLIAPSIISHRIVAEQEEECNGTPKPRHSGNRFPQYTSLSDSLDQ